MALTLSTLFVAVALAIPIGVVAAWKARKLVDRLVMGFAVLGFAMPVFVLAYVLIYFFAVQLAAAAGAGLSADRRGPVAVRREPDPALGGARRHLHGADRPHHARLDAGGAGSRTTSAPPTPRAWRPTACCCCMR